MGLTTALNAEVGPAFCQHQADSNTGINIELYHKKEFFYIDILGVFNTLMSNQNGMPRGPGAC